jgi:hypothetical protein
MLREEPRADLGGYDAKGEPLHPEPDFDYVPELIKLNAQGASVLWPPGIRMLTAGLTAAAVFFWSRLMSLRFLRNTAS